VKISTPYSISLSIGKLKKLDVYEPMDPDAFNMGVRILAPNALEKSKGQRKTIRKHYMDLEFNVCH
jgi:isopropylmalate/homocitrate/citramalate synthase